MRFSAAQSFVYFGALVVVYVVLRLIGAIPVLGTIILGPIVGLLTFIILAIGILTWLFLMYQAHRGKTIRLPFFAGYADAMIQRFSKK
ncbi:MAG: hypothetical protein IMW89_22940 [Ktedonobacteraceae bacterium]|nr:hypothetical protein [Ktedonobacteraceae bacterium]